MVLGLKKKETGWIEVKDKSKDVVIEDKRLNYVSFICW